MIINGNVWNFNSHLSAAICYIVPNDPNYFTGLVSENAKYVYKFQKLVSVLIYPTTEFLWDPLILVWIYNYIHYKEWDQITYLFLNFNGAGIGVVEWMSNFTQHFDMRMFIHSWWDES